LAAASTAEAREVSRRVQEITLQQWPVAVLVTATGAASRELNCLHGHVSGLFHWPRDSRALARIIEERLSKGSQSKPGPEASLPEIVRGDFLRLTPALWPLADHLAVAAVQDTNVLITGEPGTGKSFLARVVHACSSRRHQRFVVVPCGALVPSVIQSELLGHAQGAITGADRARGGRFAAAGEGTLLLDEIEALGLEQQANLLRVIETGEFEPVGTQLRAARVIAASTVNLEKAVQAGRFRPDLYSRLSGLALHVPPLRERGEDIPLLARGIVARFNCRFNKGLFDISPEVITALRSMPWPGNLRQLENTLLQAVLYSTGPELRLQHLPPAAA
jgi:DNA-binding NtrC family response regulator